MQHDLKPMNFNDTGAYKKKAQPQPKNDNLNDEDEYVEISEDDNLDQDESGEQYETGQMMR